MSYVLNVLTGESKGKVLQVPDNGGTLGRSSHADIHFDDGAFSRMHCKIDITPDRVTIVDLNSSNGTILNGKNVEQVPLELKSGDIISAGDTSLQFFKTKATPDAVNLGFGGEAAPAVKSEPPKSKNHRFVLIAIGSICVLSLLVMAAVLFMMPAENEKKPRAASALKQAKAQPAYAFNYERLDVTEEKLFRYRLTYDAQGVLSLTVDDLGVENRSFTKKRKLSKTAQENLVSLLRNAQYWTIPEMLNDVSADPANISWYKLTILQGADIWSRSVENSQGKPEFNALCKKLELFGSNELEAWASQYSVGELRQLGREQFELAKRYWNQRDLGEEKLAQALDACRLGLSYIETLNPKPDYAEELRAKNQEVLDMLNERYKAAQFNVDQAMSVQDYNQAHKELQRICRLIPDREDPRNQQAVEKLLLIESRYSKGLK